MKKLIYIFLVLFLMISCRKEKVEEKKITETPKKQVEQNILVNIVSEKLDSYIKEYPLPENTHTYNYQISFNDNFFDFMRMEFPPLEEKQRELKGAFYYKDSIIVSVIDSKKSKKSHYYNSLYFAKNLKEKLLYENLNLVFDESFPPIWKYKIDNGKSVLVEVDTVWRNWK